MKIRHTVVAVIAALLLTNCAQSSIGSPLAPNAAASAPVSHKGDLLYTERGTTSGSEIDILTFPQGVLVKSFLINDSVSGMCSGPSGNVWIVTLANTAIEYAHGGSQPIANLTIPYTYEATGCAVDPSTGNLAIINYTGHNGSSVDVWTNGSGPAIYPTSFYSSSLVYDDKGNLFVAGRAHDSSAFVFAELRSGSQGFMDLTLDKPAQRAGGLQWDGKYLAVETAGPRFPLRIYRVKPEGSQAKVVATLRYHGMTTKQNFSFVLSGNTVISAPGACCIRGDELWHYPGGRDPYQLGLGPYSLYVAVSSGSKSR